MKQTIKLIVLLIVVSTQPALAALIPGEIIAVAEEGEVFSINPETGHFMLLSGKGRGIGPAPTGLNDVGVGKDGNIYALSSMAKAIIAIDPSNGDRNILSSNAVGNGPEFGSLQRLAIDATGNLLVTDRFNNAVFLVDRLTGSRQIVSGDNVGAGPLWDSPLDLTIDQEGNIIVVDHFANTIYSINPVTGDRTIVSRQYSEEGDIGEGGDLFRPTSVATNALGQIIVGSDLSRSATLYIDPQTGNRSSLSDIYGSVFDLEVAESGAIYASLNRYQEPIDSYDFGLVSIDPDTGQHSLINSELHSIRGISVVPATIPEPSVIILLAVFAPVCLRRNGIRGSSR